MIKELPLEFIGTGEVDEFEFKQIYKSSNAYMYKVSLDGRKPHYEVFERTLTPICIDYDKKIYSDVDFKVKYPKSNDFGRWAWTYNDYDKACDGFCMVEQVVVERINRKHETI